MLAVTVLFRTDCLGTAVEAILNYGQLTIGSRLRERSYQAIRIAKLAGAMLGCFDVLSLSSALLGNFEVCRSHNAKSWVIRSESSKYVSYTIHRAHLIVQCSHLGDASD